MLKLAKTAIILSLISLLSACVTVKPEPPIIVNGAVGYLERVRLPQGSEITIAIVNLDVPGKVIAQKNFNIARAPVPFKFLLPKKSIDSGTNYGMAAMIKHKGQVIFQTFEQYPVINNGVMTTEVWVKMVR